MDTTLMIDFVRTMCATSAGDAYALVTFWQHISQDYAERRVREVIKAYEEGHTEFLTLVAEHAENTHLADIRKRIALGYLEKLLNRAA